MRFGSRSETAGSRGHLYAIWLALLLWTLSASACSNASNVDDSGPDLAAIKSNPVSYLGTRVSMNAFPVYFTALYLTARGEIAGTPEPGGWLGVALVNPMRPVEGMLLCTHAKDPLDEVARRPSGKQHVAGTVRSFERADAVRLMKEKYGCELLVDAQGHPIFIESELPIVVPHDPPAGTGSGAPHPTASGSVVPRGDASPAARDASPAARDASPAARDASPAARDASPGAASGSPR